MLIMFLNILAHVESETCMWRSIIKLQIKGEGKRYHKIVNEEREIPKEEANMQTTKR